MRGAACTLFAGAVYDFKFARDGTNPQGRFGRAAEAGQSERVYFLKLGGAEGRRRGMSFVVSEDKSKIQRMTARGRLIVSYP